jgi:hypothetical protein
MLSMTQTVHPKTSAPTRRDSPSSTSRRVSDPYQEWLDTPKNLSGPALAEARGLIRIRSVDGRSRKWVERSEVGAMLDAGWLLDD